MQTQKHLERILLPTLTHKTKKNGGITTMKPICKCGHRRGEHTNRKYTMKSGEQKVYTDCKVCECKAYEATEGEKENVVAEPASVPTSTEQI